MGYALVCNESERAASCDSRCSGSGLHLEAAQVNTIDVGYSMVVLVVLRLADRRPLFGFGLAVYDEFRKSV